MLAAENNAHPANFISQYPPPSASNGHNAPQAYMHVDPQLDQGPGHAHGQPQNQQLSQSQTIKPSKGKKGENAGESKVRLRKACDSCSARKVKCDESGPPCQACHSLQIPCTFNRQSKRRGPPNKHAENLKKGRFDADGSSGMSQPSSPTQTAQTLAAFAQQAVLSAESICPLPIIHSLVEDFFTYIHPLIPVPHKPSFMAALEQREDLHHGTFLALLASMLGCLVANYPRRPRQHFRHHNIQQHFPNSMSFVSRCQQVTLQAQGIGYLKRELTIHDAIISYLQGITAAYTYDRQSTLIYFKQCLSIMSTIGVHKTNYNKNRSSGAPQARMIPNGHVLEGPQPGDDLDCIELELRKRTFWLMFVGVRSLQQIGVSQWELMIPPATKSQPYPPLPIETDDEYLTPTHIIQPPPPAIVSELAGFNANVRVYTTYDDLVSHELLHGADEVADWERQKRILKESLAALKRIHESLSPDFGLDLSAPQPQPFDQSCPSLPNDLGHYASTGFEPRLIDYRRFHALRKAQCDIQRANIHASYLATHSYLVEKYFTLSDAHTQEQNPIKPSSSPDPIAPSLEPQIPSPSPDHLNQEMTLEREAIVKSTLKFISTITQTSAEPNGISFISKIRQVASTLLDKKHARKSSLATSGEEYLKSFLGILTKLEGGGGGESRDDGVLEDDEEAQLRHWADLRAYQTRFHQSGGFSP